MPSRRWLPAISHRRHPFRHWCGTRNVNETLHQPVRQTLDSDTRWLVHFAIIAAAAGLIAIALIAIFLRS